MHPELMQQLAAARIRDLLAGAGEARRTHGARHPRRQRTPARRRRSTPAKGPNPARVMEPRLARRGTRTR